MNRRNVMRKLLLIILLSFSIGEAVWSQSYFDARTLGMAGSNIAIAEGTEHIGGNPATLALHRDFNFELHVLSAHVMAKNNSFSLNEYDRFFTTGDSLTSQDIDDLLGFIPDEGLRMDMAFGAKTFSFYARPFSLTFTAMGNGYVNLPKSPFELPFYGNVNKDEYHLDDLEGEGWGAAAVNFSIAFPVTQWFSDYFDFVSVGVSPKYFFGLGYANTEVSEGSFLTTDEYILADGHVEILKSEGGSGLGLDLGFLAEYNEQWTFSLDFTNAIGSIKWTEENAVELFEFYSDSIRFNDLDSLDSYDRDTTLVRGDFTTGLPRAMRVAAAYQYHPKLVLTASWQQGLNENLGNSTTPLVSFGTEYKPISVIPLRAGFGLGGHNGFALGLGMGIDLKYWQLNVGYLNHNFKWFRSAKSVEFALTTQFRF